MKQYPDVYIPQSLKTIANAQPPVPSPPPQPNKPIKPVKLTWSVTIGLGVVSSIVLVVMLQSFFALILAFALTIAFRFWRLSEYKKELKEFDQKSKHYPQLLEAYQKEKKYHEESVKKLLSPENIRLYKKQLLKNFVSGIYQPDGFDSSAQKGVCEGCLLKEMKKRLTGECFSGTWLQIPNQDYPFSPDICYIHQDLYFDIEVDEPYYQKAGDFFPYHGYDEWKDKNRNDFFVNRDWIIIRFAEEQVARYPESCVKTIAKVLEGITGVPIPASLQSIPNLQPIPRWTTNEARELIRQRYRNTYLNSTDNIGYSSSEKQRDSNLKGNNDLDPEFIMELLKKAEEEAAALDVTPQKSELELHLESVERNNYKAYLAKPPASLGNKRWKRCRDVHMEMLLKYNDDINVQNAAFGALTTIIEGTVYRKEYLFNDLNEVDNKLGRDGFLVAAYKKYIKSLSQDSLINNNEEELF